MVQPSRISARSISTQRAGREVEQYAAEARLGAQIENTILAEAYENYSRSIAMLDKENEGWKLYSSFQTSPDYGLEQAKETATKATQIREKSGLLKTARETRANIVFGRGAPVEGTLQPRFQAIVDDPMNQQALFSVQAQVEADGSLFDTGFFFTVWDSEDKVFEVVPLDQIVDVWYNPRRPSEVWYYRRQFSYVQYGSKTGNRIKKTEDYWIPVDTYARPAKGYETTINQVPVKPTLTIIDGKVNVKGATRMGVPDSLVTLPWAVAYPEALRSDLKLRVALSSIAWLVKQRSAKGVANTGATIVKKQGQGSGQTVVATEGTELQSMPRSGAVNMDETRPLAAMVAAPLGLTTSAILGDTITNDDAALSLLAKKTFETRQEFWASYFARAFKVIGIKGTEAQPMPTINFPKIRVDPRWRVEQGLTLGRNNGAINQKEYRRAMAEAGDVILDAPDTMPKPDAWTGSKKNQWTKDAASAAGGTPTDQSGLPSQGVAGDVGAIDKGTNDAAQNGEFSK